ncbi:MAG: hypothetical protein A2Z20_00510 [Bdellovibrionales bacterium RBG_16_40_8]|nr:MAG: hypothetical protein A2Z20_00510 [Bdellovibrionales bacterium RBG_16_40_8]
MKQLALLVVSLLAFSVTQFIASEAQAGPRNKKIMYREGKQRARIHQGVRSGELTKDEAKGLRQEQRKIHKMRKEARKDDGHIDKQEMKEIRHEQNEASKEIYQEKHDDDKR